MKIPTVEYCCCGCSLRTGTLIIAVFGMIFFPMSAIVSGAGLVAVQYVLNRPEEKSPQVDQIRAEATELMVVFVALLIYSVLAFIINCILLMGTNQNKARLVRMWVIVSLVLFFIQLGLVILDLIFNPQPTVIILILSCLFEHYFIVVVHSFYKQMCQDGAVQ